jgi:hypothetical protein
MRKCKTCGKDMKIFEGYNWLGDDYCIACYDKKNSIKNKTGKNSSKIVKQAGIKTAKKDKWQDGKEVSIIFVVIVIIVTVGFFIMNAYADLGDYEICIDSCVSREYSCMSSISPLYSDYKSVHWSRDAVKSCHNELETCVLSCGE